MSETEDVWGEQVPCILHNVCRHLTPCLESMSLFVTRLTTMRLDTPCHIKINQQNSAECTVCFKCVSQEISMPTGIINMTTQKKKLQFDLHMQTYKHIQRKIIHIQICYPSYFLCLSPLNTRMCVYTYTHSNARVWTHIYVCKYLSIYT